MRIAAIFVFCCRTAVIHAIHGTSTEEYIRLQESLLENYSNEVRPVVDRDKTVFILTSYYLTSINEVDVVGQRLITTGFLLLHWKDEFLQWDKESTGINMMYFKQVLSSLALSFNQAITFCKWYSRMPVLFCGPFGIVATNITIFIRLLPSFLVFTILKVNMV